MTKSHYWKTLRAILKAEKPKSQRLRRLSGNWVDALKVRVAAPPEDGEVNQAVIRLLAGHYGVNRKLVRIVSGLASARQMA